MRDASRCACWQVRLALVLIWVHASCVQSAEENLPQSKVPVGLSRCAGLARAGGAGAGAQRAEPSALARAAAGPGAGDAVRGRGRRGRPGERMEPHARQPGRRRGRSAAAAAVQGGERWPTQALPHAHVICFCAALGACAGLAREGLRHVRCCREREQARAGRVAATDSAASCLLTRMRPLSAQQFPGSAAPCLTSLMWSSRDVIGWCQSRRARVQVFKLEAGPDVDPAAARRQLQKYMGTFRGRALMGPLPLPPPAAKGAAVKVSAARASSRTGFRLCEHPRCHPVCV